MTLEDILRDEIRRNTTLTDQSWTLFISTSITMLMFVTGLINSVLSFLTFQNEAPRKTGCGMYLLASSITSLLTISMLAVQLWFFIFVHISTTVSLSVIRGGCKSIEPLLKLFLYYDSWLNACVALDRTFNVSKGARFDKVWSRRFARWTIVCLPFCIMVSFVHDLCYRDLFIKPIENGQDNKIITDRLFWCVTRYPRFIQKYNTAILFLHLVAPFLANLFSAAFIIFATARRRSAARPTEAYREIVRLQLREHKQLLISPIILLILASPRLVIALSPGCANMSHNLWKYLFGYFMSFTPSVLMFVVFVLPSPLYRTELKKSLGRWQRRLHC